jgi:hypothetical protein
MEHSVRDSKVLKESLSIDKDSIVSMSYNRDDISALENEEKDEMSCFVLER